MKIENNSAKKAKQHTVYKDGSGKRVPGVTTITGVLNKPALVNWANNLGLQGIKVSAYVDDLATIGTLAHYMVQCHIEQRIINPDNYTPNQIVSATRCFDKFLRWEKQHEVEYIFSEKQLVSDKLKVGGTLDIFAKVDGVWMLLDIKTCKAIYSDHYLQVGGGYSLLLEENLIPYEDVCIIRIGRDDAEGAEAEVKKVPNVVGYQKLFKKCNEIYQLKKELKA